MSAIFDRQGLQVAAPIDLRTKKAESFSRQLIQGFWQKLKKKNPKIVVMSPTFETKDFKKEVVWQQYHLCVDVAEHHFLGGNTSLFWDAVRRPMRKQSPSANLDQFSRSSSRDERNAERDHETGDEAVCSGGKEQREAMRDLSIQKAKVIKPRSTTPERHRKSNSQAVQMDGKQTQITVRTCRQTAASSCKGATEKIHQVTPQQRQSQCGKPVVHCSDHRQRIQHDTHSSTFRSWTSIPPSHGLCFHAAGDGLAQQEVLLLKHSNRERLVLSLQSATKNLAL